MLYIYGYDPENIFLKYYCKVCDYKAIVQNYKLFVFLQIAKCCQSRLICFNSKEFCWNRRTIVAILHSKTPLIQSYWDG
jgi:hypothetical protein